MTAFRNIREVRRLPEAREAYLCRLDLKLPGEDWETVEYCAREGDDHGIAPEVLGMIRAGRFGGGIVPFEPSDADRWLDVRERRNEALAATDHLVRADLWERLSAEVRRELAAYRQALRDLPQRFEQPRDVVFPQPPQLEQFTIQK